MGEEALLVADIQGERARALWEYEEGIIGSGKLRSWLKKLDYQARVGNTIDFSLEDSADYDVVDLPLTRDESKQAPRVRRPLQQMRPRIAKFARSL